ncbi:MAG: S8 family serine peptidase [Planctomycetota bacterium]
MRPTAATLVLCLCFAISLPGQARRGPVVKPTRFEPVAGAEDVTNLVVKFTEGSAVRLRGGAFVSGTGASTAGVMAAIANARTVERLFLRSEDELDRELATLRADLAAAVAPVDPPAELNLYFRVRMPDAATGIAAWRALLADPLIETAFPDTPPGYAADPQDIPPTTPDFTGSQGYFGPLPNGIDIVAARKLPGGRGEPLQVCDIETGLIIDHEDIPLAVAANVIGPNNNPTDHGQAVAGELVAERNGYGTTGGVWKARYKFHSHQSINWAASVNTAAANSQPGDIIVLEVQLPCPITGTSVCPMEGRQDVFDAVRNATLAGKHVVAAAGNGNQNLDNPVFQGLFNRAVRDSGAVLVGATDGATLVRASFSNYGAIVDANGWGQNVTTTGYGALFNGGGDPRQRYTATFSGTSSATPIVTSAYAATLGAAKFQLGQVLTPAQARTLIQSHGTTVATIGRRPDVAALMGALGLPNGLVLAAEVDLGGTVTLQFTASAAELAIVCGDWAGVATPTPFGRLLLDPATLIPVNVYVGAGTHATPVPNNPLLVGSEVHWQVVRYHTGTGALSLTSSVVSHFAK